jgi:hypothetical protein
MKANDNLILGRVPKTRLLRELQAPSGAVKADFEVFLHGVPSDKAKLGRLGNALKDWPKRGESQGKSHGLLVAIVSQKQTRPREAREFHICAHLVA